MIGYIETRTDIKYDENKTERENTCMLSDIPDERETLQTGQGQMERQNTETAGY